MEAKICCAYNVSRGCKISSKVIVTDYGSAPFKLMKLMLDGLAKDAEAGFWLTNLSQTPQIVRLFPFDFVYLDSDRKLIQAFELPPEAKLPRFHPRAASAVILPLNSLSASGTTEGDIIIIGPAGDVEVELEKTAAPPPISEPVPVPVPVPRFVEPIPFELSELRGAPDRTPAPKPLGGLPISTPMPSIAASQGTSHTHSLSTRWQISTSTPAGVLLETIERVEEESTSAATIRAATSVIELPGESTVGSEGDEAAEEAGGPVAIAEAEPELMKAVAEAPKILEGKEDRAPAEGSDTAFAILDTDLSRIFDSAIAEEIDGGEQQEFLRVEKVEAATPDSNEKTDTNAVVAEPIAPRAAAKTETSRPPRTGEAKSKSPVAREKGMAPARTAPTNGSRKPERSDVPDPTAGSQSLEAASGGRGRKRSFGYIVKEFLNCPDPLPESRMNPRLVQQGIVAYEAGDASTPMEVRDVSPSGLYLRTKKRWQLRRIFTLTLQRKGASEEEFQSRLNMRAQHAHQRTAERAGDEKDQQNE